MNAATSGAVVVAATGESAIRVTGTTGSPETDWILVHKLARRLSAAGVDGLTTTIPTYESVLVEFDAMRTTWREIAAAVDDAVAAIDVDSPLTDRPRHFQVPVLYGAVDCPDASGVAGPDLDVVARHTGLSPDEVIAAHCAPTYVVRCLGAPGGSPMLDAPAPLTGVPRLANPRTRVPASAVSLAGRQATITPAAAPGGWCVIGRTPLTLLDLTAEPLVPYLPGDTVSFEPIDTARFAELAGRRIAPGPLEQDPR